ncbi:DUF580-domain-containing protein [Mycena rebaudengoi]|nr:DUF580-domain-containing protein [Mycena rebaudengoi]
MSWQQQPTQWSQQQQPLFQPPNGPPPGPTPQYANTYAPPSQPYPPPSEPYYDGDNKSPYENNRFKPKKKINDPIFLLLIHPPVPRICSADGGLGGGLGKTKTGTKVTLNQSTVYLLLLVTAAALLLSTIYLMLVRAFTKVIMHVTLVLSIILNIFTIIAIFSVLSYFGFRSRIPLASLLLQVVMDVSKHHMSVYVVAFLALILQALLAVWFTFAAIATYAKYTPGNPSCATDGGCSSGKVAGLIFFEVFSFLWTSQVIGNAPLAAGTTSARAAEGEMPKHPTLSAFGRASTLSLGSIAFGSLIVTLLELLKMVLNAAQHSANADGHPVEACLACCAACFVGIIESLVEYFNSAALYGKPYIAAAKDTWRLLQDRGVSAIVNDSLVGMTLTWGGYIVGLLCSLFSYLYLRLTSPAYNADGDYTAPVILFAFLIGLQCSLTLSSAIEAGVSTIFVGLGEDPQVLAVRAPALFALIAQTYPDVVRAVV